MLPDRVSNPGSLTYESGVLPIALRGPACVCARVMIFGIYLHMDKTILPPPSMYGFNISEAFDFRPFFQPCIRTAVMELGT